MHSPGQKFARCKPAMITFESKYLSSPYTEAKRKLTSLNTG